MAFAFDVTSGIPRLTQSGTDTGLGGIATAINAVATVARSTAYNTAAIIKPPTPTGMWYRCSTAGTTAATAPTYNGTLNSTTTDGTAVFTAVLAPDIRTLGTANHYYMPQFRVNITGQLTNANPQIQNFTCWDVICSTTGSTFTSGQWASDGVTPLYDGLHFCATRVGFVGSDDSTGGLQLQLNSQCTFIGGEVQVAGAVGFSSTSTPRSYQTRWRNTKDWGGVTSSRFRSYSTTAIFRDCEFFDMAFDLFRMPAEFSVKARGSEYLAQYVGAAYGGADARFVASNLENVDGIYDFDNFGSGWVELYNCKQGEALKVTSQNTGTPATLAKHCVPLYQDLIITAKDTSGVVVPDVRFTATEIPTNSPTITITTTGNLKTWDFRNPLSYETTTNSSGIATTTPVLNVWYWQTSFKESLRFPSSTAVYQGRAYNYKTLNVSVLLGASAAIPVSAGMVALDTATTVNEATAGAITGITLTPSGATGGTITISSNKSYQDIWNYYRYWISQFANKTSNDTWTCIGGTLNTQNWNIVVNTGVTITSSANISTLRTLGTVTLNGTAKITAVYQDIAGTSTVLELNPPSNGYSLCIFKADGTTKYFQSNVNAGSYYVYFAPSEAGTYYLGAENYGQKRTADTLVLSGGNVWYNITDQEDVGITDNFATASAYTTLSTTSQIYDATAIFRLTETGIKLGQLVARDGLYLDFTTYNVKIKDDASAIVSVASGTITYKSIVINESLKYNAMKATPPKTITPTDTEIINVLVEDANGDSQVSILGGDNLGYELWKVTTATPTDNYATGTLLTTLATNALPYRFIGISGFDIVGRDTSSGVRRRSSMLKGSYEQAFYVGNQIQLATDAPQLQENNDKIDELTLKVDTNLDVKVSTRATAQQVWEYITRTLTSAGASGATLAEIEASTILAKEATSQAIKAKTDKMEFNASNHIAANVHQLQAGAITAIQDGLSLEVTSQDIKTKVLTLPTLAEMESEDSNLAKNDLLNGVYSIANSTDITVNQLAGNDFDAMTDSLDAISAKVDLKPSLADIENSTILAKETSVQDVKTKVDTLSNYDDATAQSKLDAIKAKTDTLVNTDLTGITEDLTIINNGVKKASLLIPHTDSL
jgi:hypothetical protein